MTDEPKPLIAHLDELRSRLIVVLVVVALSACGCYFFVDRIIAFLAKPVGGFVFFGPTAAFMARLNISLVLGAFLAVPIIIYEICRFVVVALEPEQRKMIFSILPASYVLFVAGAAVAWLIVIPTAVKFLLGFASADLKPMLSIDAYVSFVVWLTVAFGTMFQLPIIVFLLDQGRHHHTADFGRLSPPRLLAWPLSLPFYAGPRFFSQMAL